MGISGFDKISSRGFLIAVGLLLMMLSPIAIAVYAILTGTLGILGVVLASIGTIMTVNFYNVKKDSTRLLGLLIGPAIWIIGIWMIFKF